MGHLDLLIPFALPPTALAQDILPALNLPATATILAKGESGTPVSTLARDTFSRSLPHERWLAEVLAIPGDTVLSSPAAGPCLLREAAIDTRNGWWFVVQPAHLHIALDHLVLTDLRNLSLSAAESQRLFDAARPLFEDAGLSLHYVDTMHWLIRADAWQDLLTATPDIACGRNIDIWMPVGSAAAAWRKLQNEVQMVWFAEFNESLQAEREARGLKPVNSLWLWGGGPADSTGPAGGHDVVYNLGGAMACCGARRRMREQAADVIADMPCRGLLVADDLSRHALAGDWSEWIRTFHDLEARWIEPFLVALREGRLATLTLILSDSDRLATRRCTRSGLRKFWKKPSLHFLTA